MKLLEPTLASVPIARPIPDEEHPQGLCLDRGYDNDVARELAVRQCFEPHIRTRGEEVRSENDITPTGVPAAGSSRPATRGSTATAAC